MRLIQAGTTDQSITFRALTSAGATATPAYNDAGIAATYKRDATGAATAISLATQTSTGAHSDGGLVHIGGGVCRLDLPDAAVADGATRVTVTVNATGWVGFVEEILLVDYDPTGPVTANVTQLLGTAWLTPATAGTPDVNTKTLTTGAVTAGSIASAAAAKIADVVLRRSWASASASSDGDTLSFRSLLGAVAKLVNKVAVSGSTLTVYKEDDATSLGTQTVTADAAAEPIISVDTVG